MGERGGGGGVRSDFDSRYRVLTDMDLCAGAARRGCAGVEQIERGENEEHLWAESCLFAWLAPWLPGSPAPRLPGTPALDEYCMVPCFAVGVCVWGGGGVVAGD